MAGFSDQTPQAVPGVGDKIVCRRVTPYYWSYIDHRNEFQGWAGFLDFFLPFLAACRVAVVDNGNLMLSLLVAGLIGGASHCVAMCGPFVLAQTSTRLAAVPAARMSEWSRAGGAVLLPYHLGRLVTYAGLGTLSASLAGGLGTLPGLGWLSAGLLAAAAVAFLGYGLLRLDLLPARTAGPAAGGTLGRLLSRWSAPLFADPVGWRGFALGLVLGFLPCGLLYGALAAAAASGSALGGLFAMAAFAAGTVPALVAVGLAGHFVARRWQPLATRAGAFLMVVNGGVLAWFAWRLVA